MKLEGTGLCSPRFWWARPYSCSLLEAAAPRTSTASRTSCSWLAHPRRGTTDHDRLLALPLDARRCSQEPASRRSLPEPPRTRRASSRLAARGSRSWIGGLVQGEWVMPQLARVVWSLLRACKSPHPQTAPTPSRARRASRISRLAGSRSRYSTRR
jgi:hypothetical protein